MSYESPIKIITEFEYKLNREVESNIVKAVCAYGIDIDKDELQKLLLNDRKQYDKGYADGRLDAVEHGHWIKLFEDKDSIQARCSACGMVYYLGKGRDANFCGNCGAKMDEEVNHERTD